MDLKLYDTLTRTRDTFRPLDETRVRMYVCGPTVYDFAHIGNARPLIVFDVLFRLLRHIYGPDQVVYARNITDVDDKINARAAERGVAIRDLTEATYREFAADVRALGCLPPTVEPRATEHIAEMRELIERLVAAGNAYVAEDHVLFDVPSMADYGKLSKRSLDEMIAGARIDVAPYKRDPMDFVLWKPSKPGEPAWESPSGITTPGRPGWHIECSAMAWKHLGEIFDIHGGGIDLVFPHHENEIAQSRCAFHAPVMASVWMHNGFLQVEGEKMAKSAGNFITIRELLEKLPGDVIRLHMLMTHYRQPIDWTESRAELARNELEDWAHAIFPYYSWKNDKIPHAVIAELADDLNTPNAIAVLREQYSAARRGGMEEKSEFAAGCQLLGFRELGRPGLFEFGVSALNVGQHNIFKYSDAVKGLRAAIANEASAEAKSKLLAPVWQDGLDVQIDERRGSIVLVRGNREELEAKVNRMVEDRNAARARKDWAESDRIRNELAAMGVVLKDSKDGTTWELVKS